MNKFILKVKEHRFLVIGLIFTWFYLIAYAIPLTVPVISDETVTMANGAYLAGYDWSYMIAACGGLYYKYVQALMTAPLFWLCKDPAMVYRLTMVIHALLHGSIVWIVYVIGVRHLRIKKKEIAVLLGIVACLIPANVLYAYYSRGDVLLGIFPWYVLACFLETVRACEETKRGKCMLFTALAIIFSILSYMAHTRGIIVIIALFMTAVVVRFFMKRKSLSWAIVAVFCLLMLCVDHFMGNTLKSALYAVGGANANTVESTNMTAFFDIFSLSTIKAMIMLCISWLYTLCSSTYGLVLVGLLVSLLFIVHIFYKKECLTYEEKIIALFGLLIFVGYFLVGVLFFKGIFTELSSGALKKRSDRMVYDRYAVCGISILMFLAGYVLTLKTHWLSWKNKGLCVLSACGISAVFFWKIHPLITKYPGYLYNTIILNTFQKIEDAWSIMTGAVYNGRALVLLVVLAFVGMLAFFWMSGKGRAVIYMLALIIAGECCLVHVNYLKIRKSTNDAVVESTNDVVNYLRNVDEVTTDFPYVLKGGISGTKIQYYQAQLMKYKLFGKRQEAQLNTEDFLIISASGDIDLTWYEDDYYFFDDFDYANAEYDIVYVKGNRLKDKMESLGHKMRKYE